METKSLSEAEYEAEKNAGDELSVLKSRARLMGIVFSNNIGLETLRQKIQEKQSESDDEVIAESPLPMGETVAPKQMTLREMQLRDEMKLVRLRITNMDPKKKDLPGEILTVANDIMGTVSKYIPFGETTDSGYHVPFCLYTLMKAKKFLNIRVTKGINGQPKTTHSWANEFALEILPTLTKADLAKLATEQAAAGIIVPSSENF